MNKFCKLRHLSIKNVSIVVAVSFCLAPIGRLQTSDEKTLSLVVSSIFEISVFLLGAFLFVRFFESIGLYVNQTEIYYKRLRKKRISPQQISAIKVARAFYSGIGAGAPLKGKDGKQLYTMFLLEESDWWKRNIKTDISDNGFESSYKKHIIGRCIYDQSVIDYLLTLNPNIIVF